MYTVHYIFSCLTFFLPVCLCVFVLYSQTVCIKDNDLPKAQDLQYSKLWLRMGYACLGGVSILVLLTGENVILEFWIFFIYIFLTPKKCPSSCLDKFYANLA